MSVSKIAIALDGVVWAELHPAQDGAQAGRSPVLVLSHDVFNERSNTVIAVALTSQDPRVGFPLTLEPADSGLPKHSWAKIRRIRTLSTLRPGRRPGRAPADELRQMLEGLDEVLA